MRIHKFVFVFFVIIFLISCSNDDDKQSNKASGLGEQELYKLTEDEAKVLIRMRNPKSRVNVEEALEQANWVIDFLNAEEPGTNRKIKSVSALASDDIEFAESLKSNGIEVPDTLIYIVNFNDSLGFAIISADTRIDDPLLAFVGNGSLMDSVDNPGVTIFLEHLEDYMLNSIVEAERQKGSLIDGILGKLNIGTSTKATLPSLDEVTLSGLLLYVVNNPPEIVKEIKPLMPVEWSQGEPFNENLDNSKCTSGKNLTGCVTVAVAQIMSRWKHPSKIGNYSFNWDELNKYKRADDFKNNAPDSIKKQVANLMKQIGKGVGMSYGCTESSASKSSGINFLLSNGFSLQKRILPYGGLSIAVLINYNSNMAIASMKAEEPLIVRGCSKKTNYKIFGFTIYTSYDKCHQWVIDGYLERRTSISMNDPTTMKLTEISSKVGEYIHNNWGWGNDKNGYFKNGVFNSIPGPDIPSSGAKSSEDYNYQYEIKMSPYIRR